MATEKEAKTFEKVKFCKDCPIDKFTGKQVYCTKCGMRQINRLGKYLK